MKICVGILTRNRRDLFRQTVESIKRTEKDYARVIVDNGSKDGTEKLVRKMSGGVINKDNNQSIGYGMRLVVEEALKHEPDIILVTADDYDYGKYWLERLIDFWENAPEKVAICSANVEPIFHWNVPTGAVQVGEQWALIRNSLPGANWSFRASFWPELEPMIPADRHQYDRATCAELVKRGYWLCAIPLAEHIGAGKRSWGKIKK